MKSFIYLLLILSSFSLYGQDWFQSDDLWTFRFFAPFSTSGFMEMTVLRDTVVNGQLAKVMQEDYTAIKQSNGDSVLITVNPIVYEFDKRVYILDNRDSFRLNYDFNLSVGDSIIYDIDNESVDCALPVVYHLDSLADFVVGTDTLVHQFFSYKDFNWDFEGKREVIETIGTVESGFDMQDIHVCFFDAPGTWLCSFSDLDNEVPLMDRDCYELPVSTEDFVSIPFVLSPNPVTDRIQIKGIDYKRAEVYNLQGEMLATFNREEVIDVSSLFGGIYLIIVESASGQLGQQTFVKL